MSPLALWQMMLMYDLVKGPGNARLFNYCHQFSQYLVIFTRNSFQFHENIKKM